MTRKELHEFAINARKYVQAAWYERWWFSKKYKLYCKCRGIVVGDRVEIATFNPGNKALHSRAFE